MSPEQRSHLYLKNKQHLFINRLASSHIPSKDDYRVKITEPHFETQNYPEKCREIIGIEYPVWEAQVALTYYMLVKVAKRFYALYTDKDTLPRQFMEYRPDLLIIDTWSELFAETEKILNSSRGFEEKIALISKQKMQLRGYALTDIEIEQCRQFLANMEASRKLFFGLIDLVQENCLAMNELSLYIDVYFQDQRKLFKLKQKEIGTNETILLFEKIESEVEQMFMSRMN